MRRVSSLTFAFSILAAFALQTASAQITIRIPDIPRIKTPKQEQPKQSEAPRQEQPTTTTTNGQTHQPATIEAGDGQPATQETKAPSLLSYFVSEINKAKKQVDEYSQQAVKPVHPLLTA